MKQKPKIPTAHENLDIYPSSNCENKKIKNNETTT